MELQDQQPVGRMGPLVPRNASSSAQAAGRWPGGFGPRFFVLLLVGLVWVGPGTWDVRFAYGMLLWDLLVVAAWAWDWTRLPRPDELAVARLWNAPVALAVKSEVEVEVRNRGRVSVRVEAVDDVPVTLRREPASLELFSPAGGEGRASYKLSPGERGDARLGSVHLRYQSGLRLAERWARADLAQTVRVYPDLDEAKRHTIYLLRSRQIELEKRLTRYRGLGREFESLREYVPGDEKRDVCWTASARRGKLITKVYQVERSQAVWIVVDAGRLLRARVAGLTKLDYAVNAALSLAQVALYSGDRVGLLAYGRTARHRVPAARGSAHLRALVEQLAVVRGEAYEADHLGAAFSLVSAQKRRSLVVWITDLAETAMTPDVIQGAYQLMPRHLLLFCVIGNPELTQLSAKVPTDVAGMYQHVAAQEMVQRRELLLRQLRQHGALAHEMEPGNLSTALVNHYLEVKERSLL
ncbi:MAG: DUF58 domain-containing protein [Acidobacteria bacterium]|nr:DUF58 domain-containing protein [Acidobacteriota bacterium]